jgi:hypothetical protein
MSVRTTRARVAALTKHHPDGSPALTGARRDHAAEKLAENVAKIVAQAPPLSAAQRDRIAALLRGGAR